MTPNNAVDYFHYEPNKLLAVMSMVTYMLLTIYFTSRVYTSNSASFLYILPGVAFFQATGFIYRMFCINFTTLGKYVVMTLFLMVPPYVLPIVNCIALGKFIRSSNVQATQFFLKPAFVSWFFFIANILCFWILKIYNDAEVRVHENDLGIVYVLLNFCVYSVLFTCFIFVATYVYQSPKYNYYQANYLVNSKGKLFLAIYTTTALQFVRTVFGFCGDITGLEGSIATSEWAFYVFNIFPIMLTYFIYSILFIGDYLPKEDNSRYQYSQLSESDSLDEDVTENGKHVAVFNNVQSVNYSIGLEP